MGGRRLLVRSHVVQKIDFFKPQTPPAWWRGAHMMGVWTGAGERDADALALMPLLPLVDDNGLPCAV